MAKMSYEIRPSKAIARLIFVDILRHLSPLAPISSYQYVGFGALEFIDFDLIHRQLGIADMISIESDTADIARYKWNRPFNGIAILPGKSTTVLPSIAWSRLSIVWLDYTSALNGDVIADIQLLARVLIPGSILAVTVNAQPAKLGQGRRAALERAITAERVPLGTTEARLGGWGLADVQWKVLTAELRTAFRARSDAANWQQLLNINYQDRAQMQMIAGIVSAPALELAISQLKFEEIPEVRTDDHALYVRVPLLTARERTWLEQRLPPSPGDPPLELVGIQAKDLKAYQRVYRRLAAAG